MLRMNSVKYVFCLFTIFILSSANSLMAFCNTTLELEILGGWRRDEFKRDIVSANHIGADDFTKYKNINIWQGGVGGRIYPNHDTCGNCWWLNGFFIRGRALWGSICSGSFTDTFQLYDIDRLPACNGLDDGHCSDGPCAIITPGDELNFKGKIKGNTRDFTIGVGYLFCWHECLRFGPVAGWSYDREKFKMKHVSNDFSSDPLDNFDEGGKWKTRWKGPWIGVDLLYVWCNLRFDFSYEYHWAKWRGGFTLAPEFLVDSTNFSTVEKADDAYGNVFNIHADYYFCECFYFGLGFRYEYYKARNGVETPVDGQTFGDICDNLYDEYDIIRSVKWRSFAITANLGYEF